MFLFLSFYLLSIFRVCVSQTFVVHRKMHINGGSSFKRMIIFIVLLGNLKNEEAEENKNTKKISHNENHSPFLTDNANTHFVFYLRYIHSYLCILSLWSCIPLYIFVSLNCVRWHCNCEVHFSWGGVLHKLEK